jgi:hypothetical protein
MFRRVDRPAAGLRELIRARRLIPPPGRYALVVHGDYRSVRLANERETSASKEKPVGSSALPSLPGRFANSVTIPPFLLAAPFYRCLLAEGAGQSAVMVFDCVPP